MPVFSNPEQPLINRRKLLGGTVAVVAAACIPASAADGVAFNSIAHPEVVPIAAQKLFYGDIVKYVNGNVARITSWGEEVIAGVVTANAEAGEPVHVAQLNHLQHVIDDDVLNTLIKDQHDSPRQNANGFRIHRRRND